MNDAMNRFVGAHNGTRAISKVLIANNGIAAVKLMRSVRQWAYETFANDRAVSFVAMATPEDLAANAEYIRMADHFVPVAGGGNNHNYANVDLIVDIAERVKVDAVWAGWGHASENPELSRRLTEAGIVFIGPPAKAMHDLGDKIASTLVAQAAQVPCVPWSGSNVQIDYESTHEVPVDKFAAACVRTLAEAEAAIVANGISYPVMLKASEGGGGKGIRKVLDAAALGAALRMVQSEVPGSPIFIMQLVANARHLEVQVLGDAHGNAIALHGRDCSIQRRHQKIVEEGPPIAALPDKWDQMERGAVRLAKQVGYVSAGTVEFLYRDGEFYFLELNPRLQVEHPVTEEIMQVNMPANQLMVAMGLPLYRIRALRVLYGAEPDGVEPIDFDRTPRRAPLGHCIAVRITGENPDEGFKPTSGRIDELTFRSTPNVWGYFSVGGRGAIHEYADSQFGHVFARGATREEARLRMVLALREISIRGEIRTPLEYLARMLESDDFKANRLHTGWLDARLADAAAAKATAPSLDKQLPAPPLQAQQITPSLSAVTPFSNNLVPVMCGALVRAWHRAERRWASFQADLGHGRQSSHALQVRDDIDLIYDNSQFAFVVRRTGPNQFLLSVAHDVQHAVATELRPLSDGGVLVLIDGRKHTCHGREDATGLRLQIDGRTFVFENENDPSQLRTATPGKLARLLMENGVHIAAGTVYAEIEVMKMFLPLVSHAAGVIRYVRTEGASLDVGSIVATLALDDVSAVRRAKPFSGALRQMASPHPPGSKPAQQLRLCIEAFNNALHGYETLDVRGVVDQLLDVLSNGSLPVSEFGECLSALHGRLPGDLEQSVRVALSSLVMSGDFKDTAAAIAALVEQCCVAVGGSDEKARSAAVNATAPLRELCRLYKGGVRGRMQRVLSTLLQEFIEIEHRFEDRNADDVLFAAREQYKEDPKKVFEIALSHARPRAKTQMIGYLITRIGSLSLVDELTNDLQELSNLQRKGCLDAVLRARQVLMRFQLPSFRQRQVAVEAFLREVLTISDSDERLRRIYMLADQSPSIFDVLVALFAHPNKAIRCAAMEVYVRRAYRAYEIDDLSVVPDGPCARANWSFAPLRLSRSLALSTDGSLRRPVAASERSEGRSLEEQLASSMIRQDSLDNIALLAEAASMSDDERARSMRSARMLCCSTLAEAMAKFDMFIAEWKPPRLQYKDEFLNVLNIVVLELVNEPATSAQTTASASTARATTTSSTTGATTNWSSSAAGDISEAMSPPLVKRSDWKKTEEVGDATFGAFVRDPERVARLTAKGVRRVTLVMQPRAGSMPAYYTFRQRIAFKEDAIHRHFEPPLAHMYELGRMCSFDIERVPTELPQIHMYYGIEHAPPAERAAERTFFLRAVLREGDLFAASDRSVMQQRIVEFLTTEVEKLFTDMIDALELVMQQPRYDGARNHHFFLNIVPEFQYDPELVNTLIQKLGRRYGSRLWRLAVGEMEVLVRLRGLGPASMPLRFIVTNPTGLDFNISGYSLVKDLKTGAESFSLCYGDNTSGLDGQPSIVPYRVLDEIGRRRFRARAESTTYCYDFPALFATAALREWEARAALAANSPARAGVRAPAGNALFDCVELVLTDGDEGLTEVRRAPGLNDVGMVAWRMRIATPEYPKGREVVVIANDITHVIGSFGPREDLLFAKATTLAMGLGLPRLYVSANSGARIGVATEVQRAFGVEWVDDAQPTRGFRYLHVSEAVRKDLGDAVLTVPVRAGSAAEGPVLHHRITDIIGREHGLGVENLQGSGHIAGITSRAYLQIFTASLVTGRTVGIGAYLVRLGQRMIQNQGPVLLTGAGALNTVLGRDVYTSNNQIGGTQIMYANGVSHLVVHDELRGVQSLLQWLSFVPERRDAPLPVLDMFDPLDRSIEFAPNGQPYDPRHLIGGVLGADSHWQSGFFDRDSFVETLGGWAKTVVTGRARLGGVPIGVIIAETRTVEHVTPADPATPESIEIITQQAGQVWFPDSAYKTATAIRDFNHGERLPLMIFANWRGFSGGMRDMFEEILKYGSYIVDELSHYEQPVFVYIPPGGELRGGAWVVLDPTINNDWMEMYCDQRGRGGVLEPQGLVSVKYRQKDLLATMRRLDGRLSRLRTRLSHVEGQQALDETLRRARPLSLADIDDDRAWRDEDDDAETAKPSDETLRVVVDGMLHDCATDDVANLLRARIESREKALLPMYNQIAVSFADLHDTPGRMLAKGVISGVLTWSDARRFFGYRLRRRLAEADVIRQLREASPELTATEARTLLRLMYARGHSRAIDEVAPGQPESAYSTAFSTARTLLRRMLETAAAAAAAATASATGESGSASTTTAPATVSSASTGNVVSPLSLSSSLASAMAASTVINAQASSEGAVVESGDVSGSLSSSPSTSSMPPTPPKSPKRDEPPASWEDDQAVTQWLISTGRTAVAECCARLRAEQVARTLMQTCERQSSDTIVDGIAAFLNSDALPQDERVRFIDSLTKTLKDARSRRQGVRAERKSSLVVEVGAPLKRQMSN